MMKSPTSLIRFRNAVGVVLALSAVFAVVISTISLTSDDAQAQVDDDAIITARATAWWNLLTNVERVNVLRGNGFDNDAGEFEEGRQIGDPNRTNTNPNSDPPGHPFSPAETAQRMFAELEEVDKDAVKELVDGDVANRDIYAVGDHIAPNLQALRGFQSVEMWWNHLDCTEARIAVGEDNNALVLINFNDPFSEASSGPEPSNVCDIVDVSGTKTAKVKAYSEVKATADKVGQHILGLDSPGSSNSGDIPRAKAWWDKLSPEQRVDSLYGAGATDGDPTRTDTVTIPLTRPEKAEASYDGLDDATKALVNDRWLWIYNDGGNSVIEWWNSISRAARVVAVGVGNDAEWDQINPDNDDNDGQALQARILELGQAILGISPAAPDVAAWWATLSDDEKVNVVYGNPPTVIDPSGNPVEITEDHKKVFQMKYADLSDVKNVVPNVDLAALLIRRAVATTEMEIAGEKVNVYSAKSIVAAIANEIFDPPKEQDADSKTAGTVADDGDFDWPYGSGNGPATVADWWDTADCRVKRLAVGEDNAYLDPAVTADDTQDPPVVAKDAEASDYCGYFPGSSKIPADGKPLTVAAQKRIEEVGRALLGLGDDPGRPSFNEAATGTPVFSGLAKVGGTLTAQKNDIADPDGIESITYRWFYGDAKDYSAKSAIHTGDTYDVKSEDAGKSIKVVAIIVDNERFTETRPGAVSADIAGSPGEISRVEPAIRGITVSGGDKITLSVDIYGLQDAKDNGIGGTFEWDVNGDTIDGETGRELGYTAPDSPGTYLVTASLSDAGCQPEDEADRATACSAEFSVKVRRPSAPAPEEVAPANPPGEIPSILADSDGNQYEVFTPEEGGTFTGEGYSLKVDAGAVPNGEFLGIRMSDEGAASNVGMTRQRYTLGGNMYAISAVDSSQAVISSYVLDDPALACVPLPDELRSNISDLAVVAINDDGSLTILAAQVRISSAGAMVCGALSNLPATVAVGSVGAPAPIPTPTSEPEPETPDTGGTAPASSTMVLWSLLLGIAVLVLGSALVIARRREGARTR